MVLQRGAVVLDADNPDSRQREHRVLMAAARQLGRVPSLAEALGILDQPDGYWNDKRRKRVTGILRYIGKTLRCRQVQARRRQAAGRSRQVHDHLHPPLPRTEVRRTQAVGLRVSGGVVSRSPGSRRRLCTTQPDCEAVGPEQQDVQAACSRRRAGRYLPLRPVRVRTRSGQAVEDRQQLPRT